jgi:flagellar basal body P-ring protein FlgI
MDRRFTYLPCGLAIMLAALLLPCAPAAAQSVALKGLGRFDGWRDNALIGYGIAEVKNADEVAIRFDRPRQQLAAFLSDIENIPVEPGQTARIVINERTGTVVAGADVRISSVVVAQGDLKVTITSENYASQPSFIGGNSISANITAMTISGIRGSDASCRKISALN